MTNRQTEKQMGLKQALDGCQQLLKTPSWSSTLTSFPITHNFDKPNNPFIYSQLLHRPLNWGARNPVQGLFKVSKSKVDYLLPNKIFLMHLKKDVYSICSTAPSHKTKLYVVNFNFEANDALKNGFKTFITWSRS